MASAEVMTAIRELVAERDWSRFHTPGNLAKSIVIESAELLEHFQWDDEGQWEGEGRRDAVTGVAAELADVLTYCLMLADRLGLDADRVVLDKLAVTREKYPVELAHGRSAKYDRLQD